MATRKVSNSGKLGMLNVNGLKNEIVMGSLKQYMYDEELEVLFVTEPHLSIINQERVKQRFSEFDVFIRIRKRKRNKQYQQRGGIMCIAKKDTVKLEKPCKCDDMLWINWKGVSVAGVYFVPASSPFAKRNAKRMIELQQRILEANGKVVILTDANAWIGEIPSVITHHEEGLEKSIQTYPRTSEKKETNPQGEWFLSSMNNVDMIVLNGLKSMALCTYDHPGKEAKSIVDFVVVNQQAFKVVSDLSYVDCRESLCTDHILVSVQVEYDSKARKRKTPRRKKRRKGQMKYLRTVKQKDPFWESLAEECDRSLEDFATILGQTPTEDYAAFKAKLASAISIAWKNSKPMRTCLKATLKSDSVIVELRVKKSNLFRAVKIEKDPERRKALKDEFRQVNKKLKQRTRQAICKYQREKVAEIENLEPDECKRMWQELKNLSGWKSKVTMPEAVFDESKQGLEKGFQKCGETPFELLGLKMRRMITLI